MSYSNTNTGGNSRTKDKIMKIRQIIENNSHGDGGPKRRQTLPDDKSEDLHYGTGIGVLNRAAKNGFGYGSREWLDELEGAATTMQSEETSRIVKKKNKGSGNLQDTSDGSFANIKINKTDECGHRNGNKTGETKLVGSEMNNGDLNTKSYQGYQYNNNKETISTPNTTNTNTNTVPIISREIVNEVIRKNGFIDTNAIDTNAAGCVGIRASTSAPNYSLASPPAQQDKIKTITPSNR